MKCDNCPNDLPESLLQCSHDIPKYIGGQDQDGRHWLCILCHKKYERLILISCLQMMGEELEEGEEITWMKELSKQSEGMKELFRNAAYKIKVEFYHGRR